MDKIFRCYRDRYTAQTTLGKVYLDEGEGEEQSFFSFSLEDTVRAEGIKVVKETALAAGRYRVSVTESTRFKRLMIALHTGEETWLIDLGGIKFKGARVHGGNDHGDTEGCPLVARNRYDSNNSIQGSMEKEATAQALTWIRASHNVYWDIVNLPQEG